MKTTFFRLMIAVSSLTAIAITLGAGSRWT
jgi:hypothetical protein